MQQPISLEECNKIARKYLNVNCVVKVVKLTPLVDKEREYYRSESIIEMSGQTNKGTVRLRFFFKRYHWKYMSLVEFLISVDAFKRELHVYQDVFPAIEQSLRDFTVDITPRFMQGKQNEHIILEDLSLSSFVMSRKINPHMLDRAHVCLGLEALAKLHAASMAYERKQNSLSNDKLLVHEVFLKNGKFLQASLKGLKSLLAHIQTNTNQDLFAKLEALVLRSTELLAPNTKYTNALCHGNLHTTNLLFRYENQIPVACKLVNFEFSKYFLPAYDVLTFVFYTTTRLFRQHYFTYLITFYHACLTKELTNFELEADTILDAKQLQETIDVLIPTVKLKACLHLQDFGAKKGFYKLLKKDDESYAKYLENDKSSFILDIFEKDQMFKIMMTEALEELVEVLNVPETNRERCYKVVEDELGTTVYDIDEYRVVANADDRNKLELVIKASVEDAENPVKEFKSFLESNVNAVVVN